MRETLQYAVVAIFLLLVAMATSYRLGYGAAPGVMGYFVVMTILGICFKFTNEP